MIGAMNVLSSNEDRVCDQRGAPLPPEPREYLPFSEGPFALRLGTRAVAPAEWIEIDRQYGEQLKLKEALLGESHDEVFAALDGTEAAGREVLLLLAEHLATHFPHWFALTGVSADGVARYGRSHSAMAEPEADDRATDDSAAVRAAAADDRSTDDRATDDAGRRLTNRLTGRRYDLGDASMHPLDLAARLVQEDLCLMQWCGDHYRLRAASVAFPSRWRLAEKLGATMADVHAPVAFYDQQLAGPADRLLAALPPERILYRFNWNLHDDPALFQPTGMDRTQIDPSITSASAGERLWLRVERQTLRRLPRSLDVLFTIRTHVRPLSSIARRPEVAARLAAALRALPDETYRYKSLRVFGSAALAWLDAIARPDAGN